MSTLSLNTGITSSHTNDFYSTTGEYWIKVIGVRGNYFSNSECPPGSPMDFYVRIAGTNIWKPLGGCSGFDYYYPPCYQYCTWDFINARYYNFSNPSDPDNYKFIDKIAVIYLGLRNESFVNRCTINITAVDNNNTPLSGVKILDSNVSTINDSNFMAWTLENGGEKICTPTCRDPTFNNLSSVLKSCTPSEVSLMQTQKQDDILLIETDGIPTKLTFTISTPGVYTGTLHYQYWNGVDWVYFSDSGVIDETNGFRKSGSVTLPTVTDWKKSTLGTNPALYYICRAIFDSSLSVTTVPKASCLRWSGLYDTVTNSSGAFSFTILSSGINNINVPGTLSGYICTSGNGKISIPEASSTVNIKLSLVKSTLSNTLTCPNIVYKNQTKDILVTSTVNTGGISNTLTISSPKTATNIFNPAAGINVPVSYTFNEETMYKVQLKSQDAGGNILGKSCYVNVVSPSSCNLLTDKFSCESNKCFWTGTNCVSIDPHTELSDIYQSIIDKTVCISNECINILDLNNDGLIDKNDKDLSLALTYDETASKILSYQICKELNKCGSNATTSTFTYIAGVLAVGYIGYKLFLSNKQKQ